MTRFNSRILGPGMAEAILLSRLRLCSVRLRTKRHPKVVASAEGESAQDYNSEKESLHDNAALTEVGPTNVRCLGEHVEEIGSQAEASEPRGGWPYAKFTGAISF